MIIGWENSKMSAVPAQTEKSANCEYCGSSHGVSNMPVILRKRQGIGVERYKRSEKLICMECAKRFRPCKICGAISTSEDGVFRAVDPEAGRRDDNNAESYVCGICAHSQVESKTHAGLQVPAIVQCPTCGQVCIGHNMAYFAGKKMSSSSQREVDGSVPSGKLSGGFLACRKCAIKMKPCCGCGEYGTRMEKMFCRVNSKDKHPSQVEMCGTCMQDSQPKVQDYNFVPEMRFHSHKSATHIGADETTKLVSDPFFGVELEMDCGGKGKAYAKWAASNLAEQFYFKRDGSLSQLGVEAVSFPATLESHINKMKWNDLLNKGRECGYVSWNAQNSCGLHVHISRWSLDPTQKSSNRPNGNDVKALMAMSEFYGQNLGQIASMSGRENEQYSSLRAFADGIIPSETPVNPDGRHGGANRYWAVNFSNKYTVELRHFRGSMRLNTILMSITYAHALSAFCVEVSSDRYTKKDLSWDKFCAFIEEKARTYSPYLLIMSELNRRGLWMPEKFANDRWITKHAGRIVADVVYEEQADNPEVARSEINSNVN